MTQEEKAKIIAGEIEQVDAQLNDMKKQKEQLQQIISTFEVIRESYQAFLGSTTEEQLELDLYPETEGHIVHLCQEIDKASE